MMGSAPAIVGGQLGRYELHGAIARGGMATVFIGRMTGAAGFARTVAIKRLHPHLAADSMFAAMFADEARLAARIRHPNVIDTIDVVSEGGELFIVMDFVNGETLAKLVRAAAAKDIRIPAPVVSSIVIGALEGLHAAHEATDEHGEPLGIVHRDVSPQNILVARDGVPRVLDFGVAKASGRLQQTEGSEIKGKLAYMSPEQLSRGRIDRRCDVFAMGVVLWETLTSKRLFAGEDAASTLNAILHAPIAPPSSVAPIPREVDAVVLRALERDPDKRFATAQEMALALEAAIQPAPARHAGKWVEELAGEAVRKRAEIVRAVEGVASGRTPVAQVEDATSPSGSESRRVTSPGPSALESWRYLPPPDLPSQASMPSLPSVPAAAPGTRRSYAVAALGVGVPLLVLLVVGVLLVLVSVKARSKHGAQAASVDAAPVVSVPAEPPAAVPVAASAPAPALALEPSSAPTGPEPSSASSATASATVAVSRAPRVLLPPPVKPAKSASPAADCENPFTIDADGVKRPKPHCFAR
jgi:serine/threonine-protein kinase